jgi:hypothetical protein
MATYDADGNVAWADPSWADAVPVNGDGTGPLVQAVASMTVQLGRVATAIQADYDRKQRLVQSLRWASFQPIQANPQTQTSVAGTVTLTNAETWGPKTGYFWAIQRITVAGLVTTDAVQVFKAGIASPVGATPGNQVTQAAITNAVPFNPGRTDLILQPGDFLVINGTGLTSTSITGSFDGVVGLLEMLPDYLL